MTARDYPGGTITIRYDVKRCIHAAECVRGAPQVFDPQARPWIRPDNATAEHLAQVVARCPTSALTLHSPDGTCMETAPEHNTATLVPRGPVYLRARIRVPAGEHEAPAEFTRVALCRCGASKNKPFCDGSHTAVGFDDEGICRHAPAAAAGPANGAVLVHPQVNGPLKVEGKVEFRAADGSTFIVDKVWLCRCGHSSNKPFCDGTHKRIGFTA
jgi:CDGSH-type Zn-finger protein/uncharacterized Fe-S cluster protein YjdI